MYSNYVGNILHLFVCRDLEKDFSGNPCLMVCEDEPRCALADDKHFKIINIDNKGKVRIKCLLSAQKCRAITGTFKKTTNLKTHLKVRPYNLT